MGIGCYHAFLIAFEMKDYVLPIYQSPAGKIETIMLRATNLLIQYNIQYLI